MYSMRRYTVAQARQRFADVLDAAEKGEAVVIERRGTRFSVRAERPRGTRARPPQEPIFGEGDPAVERGLWHWAWSRSGLRFVPGSPYARRPRRR